MKPGWKNPKHADQWINTLRAYAFPVFGNKPVAEVTTDNVLATLEPIWQAKHETATRVRQRIEAVLSAAKAWGLRTSENPAAWRGHLDALLPTISKKRRVEHHAAMAFADVPAFMAELRQRSNISAWALQFIILTACRTSEVIGARWTEFDLSAGLWVVPAERMELLRCMRPGLTVHGFRSSFRDWAAENTTFPVDVVEMALARTIQNQVEPPNGAGICWTTGGADAGISGLLGQVQGRV
jgi:integrase